MKKILILILTVLMTMSLIGCSDMTFYNGSHPELFVVATHSLLGVRGGHGEDVIVLAQDAFGRTMFAYVGYTITSDNWVTDNVLAILISQKTTEEHSYFYSGINFLLQEINVSRPSRGTPASEFFNEGFIMEHFSDEQIYNLKVENSWNQELDEERLFKVRVSRRNKSRYITINLSEEKQQETYRAFARGGRLGHPSDSVLLTMDKNGNVIFFMRGSRHDRELQTRVYYPAFLFMFDVDGYLIEDTGVMELTDLWDYRDLLRAFKEANGWSFYYR